MYVKDWMDVCNVYRTQSFKMRTHNEVTKEARIKLDYWTCYWFHLFGTPSLFCQFFSPFPLLISFFFLSSFFFFFLVRAKREVHDPVAYITSIRWETIELTLKLEIAYYWILWTSTIFHEKYNDHVQISSYTQNTAYNCHYDYIIIHLIHMYFIVYFINKIKYILYIFCISLFLFIYTYSILSIYPIRSIHPSLPILFIYPAPSIPVYLSYLSILLYPSKYTYLSILLYPAPNSPIPYIPLNPPNSIPYSPFVL